MVVVGGTMEAADDGSSSDDSWGKKMGSGSRFSSKNDARASSPMPRNLPDGSPASHLGLPRATSKPDSNFSRPSQRPSKDQPGSATGSKTLMRGVSSRKPTGGSGRAGGTGTGTEYVTKDEEKLDSVPDHMMSRVPLHLQPFEVIKKRGTNGMEVLTESPNWAVADYMDNASRYRNTSKSTRSRTHSKDSRQSPTKGTEQVGDSEELPNQDEVPFISEMASRKKVVASLVGCSGWSVVAMAFLVFHALHFQLNSSEAIHRTHADNAILGMDANAAAVLSPAFAAARAVVLGFRSGLYATSNPYESMGAMLTPLLQSAPVIRYVQVAGATEQLALVLPGTLHSPAPTPNTTEADSASTSLASRGQPVVFALDSTACSAANPFGCMGLSGVPCRDSLAACWEGPAYMQLSMTGEELSRENWVWSQRLLVHSLSEPASAAGFLAVDVALDMQILQQVLESGAPEGGSAFICTEEGVVLAGFPEWERPAAATSLADAAVNLLDISAAWAAVAGLLDAVAADGRSELWHDDALIVVHPLAASMRGGSLFTAGRPSLRIVVVMPRSHAVQEVLDTLSLVAFFVAGAPFGLLTLILLMLFTLFLYRCCGECCHSEDSEDEEDDIDDGECEDDEQT